MKHKLVNTEALESIMPPPSKAFAADSIALLRALHAKEEEKIMKRKPLTVILVAALLLVLLTATALAAITLTRSKQADAIINARSALAEKYGLTPETIGLFDIQTEQKGDTWMVVFNAAGFYPPLLGDYTVALEPGKTPDAHWTHDGVDHDLWENGSLDAPVWGQKQMLKALKDKEAAAAIQAKLDWSKVSVHPSVLQTPVPLKEDEARLLGEIVHAALPGPEDIAESQALDLARLAIVEEAPHVKQTLNTADVMMTFYKRVDGDPIWDIHLYFVADGIEQGWGVVIDAHTGEILQIGAITGGNG